jgi:hypothetical protein
MRPYVEIRGFEEIVLEESFVLGIEAVPASVALKMEFVLTPRHAEYHVPKPGERECFRSGQMTFVDVTSLHWDQQGKRPARDSTGTIDYGHIDVFGWEPHLFHLEGDWGRMRISADTVTIDLDPT